MITWKRTLFFWVLVISFLITAPIIVLQAKGYHFDMKRGVFVFSGAISFKSNPQSVNIKLNQKITPSQKLNLLNGSYNLTNLAPGYYNAQISAPGFQTWEKRIAVHSGIASEFWNVLLVKKQYQKFTSEAPDIDKFFISPENNLLAYDINSDQGLIIKILDLTSKKEVTQFSFPQWNFNRKKQKENIEWSPNENYLSIPVKKNIIQPSLSLNQDKEDYLIIDLGQKKSFDFNKLFHQKKEVNYVRWSPLQKNYLFFLANHTLYKANIQDSNALIVVAKNVSSYDISQTGVYYIQEPNNLIFRVDLDGKSNLTQITNNFPEDRKVIIDKLAVYDNSRIALLTQNKKLFVYNKSNSNTYFREIGNDINSFQFSNDGKKLLFASDNEISVYYLRNSEVQPPFYENKIQNITRYADKISNVQWFKDYNHIIFSINSQIKIIELDPRDHLNCMDLFKTEASNSFAIYNNYLNRLYFVDKDNTTNNLYYINFPEKNNFLGIPGLSR